MAYGQTPTDKSLKNLNSYQTNQNLTDEERRAIAIKGGKKSGETRRKNKEFRQLLEIALSGKVKNRDGDERTKKEVAMIQLAQKCINGDLKAIELALNILGENMPKRVEVTGKDGSELIPARRLSKEEAAEMMKSFETEF